MHAHTCTFALSKLIYTYVAIVEMISSTAVILATSTDKNAKLLQALCPDSGPARCTRFMITCSTGSYVQYTYMHMYTFTIAKQCIFKYNG